jgi:hypothetical protein
MAVPVTFALQPLMLGQIYLGCARCADDLFHHGVTGYITELPRMAEDYFFDAVADRVAAAAYEMLPDTSVRDV